MNRGLFALTAASTEPRMSKSSPMGKTAPASLHVCVTLLDLRAGDLSRGAWTGLSNKPAMRFSTKRWRYLQVGAAVM